MKCLRCKEDGKEVEMDYIDLVPKLGRRSLGKQFYKYKCPRCGTVERIKPRDLKKREAEEAGA